MISIAWKRIRNQKGKSLLTVIALATITLLLSFGIQSSNETNVMVTENLENYSRGSYDVLIRAANSRTNIVIVSMN
jgi:putative ABC transport system permease protein